MRPPVSSRRRDSIRAAMALRWLPAAEPARALSAPPALGLPVREPVPLARAARRWLGVLIAGPPPPVLVGRAATPPPPVLDGADEPALTSASEEADEAAGTAPPAAGADSPSRRPDTAGPAGVGALLRLGAAERGCGAGLGEPEPASVALAPGPGPGVEATGTKVKVAAVALGEVAATGAGAGAGAGTEGDMAALTGEDPADAGAGADEAGCWAGVGICSVRSRCSGDPGGMTAAMPPTAPVGPRTGTGAAMGSLSPPCSAACASAAA